MDFYDRIAKEYDQITSADARAQRAKEFVKELLRRHRIASALDVACGTGMYTIPLALAGVRTAGADLSAPMLEQARGRAAKAGAGIEWLCEPMQTLAGKIEKKFDALLCMGNSIPHLLEEADLDDTLAGFARMLTPGGLVVIQLLNYARILAAGERIVDIDRQGDSQYVRFYDFLPGRVRFNILQIQWQGPHCRHQLDSTLLRPYLWNELRDAMERNGLGATQAFGGLGFQEFSAEKSETVMLMGKAAGNS